MSKVGQWVMEMEEDAAWMSRSVFERAHGVANVDVWERVQRQMAGQDEPDYEAMMEGYYG